MGLGISSMICQKAQDPFALVEFVEHPKDERRLGAEGVQRAINLYAKMVEFCRRRGIPLHHIRVTVYGATWKSEWPTWTAPTETTRLSFDGEGWTAARESAPVYHSQLQAAELSFSCRDEFVEAGLKHATNNELTLAGGVCIFVHFPMGAEE